ncbi:MAG: ZIP family metal transporter [Actinomycetia bacterium]|nr:ZIP family metal transporter [Actinomycetes bacterium]
MDIVLYSLMAGALGMGLGALIVALLGSSSAKTGSIFLALAAGVMTSVVFEGLIPEATSLAGPRTALIGLGLGILIFIALGYVVDLVTSKRMHKELGVHKTPDELFHQTELIESIDNSALFRAGMVMLIAMTLHKVPEGLAIGAGGAARDELGILIALMLMMHNIPEGMALASPLLAGGISKAKVVLITTLVGSMTVVGALLGYAIGGISDNMVGLALSLAAGAMLYVVFGEIVPQTILLRKDRVITFTLLAGIFVGHLIANII